MGVKKKLTANEFQAYVNAKMNKTKEQQQVINYFFDQPKEVPGCLQKPQYMSDSEYMQLINNKLTSINIYKRALSKIGIDEDEVKEIDPVHFGGFLFDKAWYKKTEAGTFVSSIYCDSWLFFSSHEVYLYQYTIYMNEDKKREKTEQYFYQDITAFVTRTEDKKAKTTDNNTIEVEENMLAVVVPGTTLEIAVNDFDGKFDKSIQGMRNLLKEKKHQN